MSTGTILAGLMLGGLYVTIALGLSLTFGVMRLVNLAYGEFLIAGAYLAWLVTDHVGIDPLLSIVVVAPVMFCLAYPIQRFLLTPLLRRGMEPPLVATFGVSLLAQTAFVAAFTGDPKSLPAKYGQTGITILGTTVRTIYVIGFAIGLMLVAATHLALTRTRYGVALRAASVDPDTASTMGINVRRLYASTLGISAAMASIGGVLIGVAFSFTPTTVTIYLVIGFTVIVLGGAGSVVGTLAGGLLVGLIQTVGGAVFGGQYQDLVVYLVFVLVIALRPRGIFNTGATI